MEVLFWITTAICFWQGIYIIIYKKDYFNIYTFLLAGIYLPLFLYLLNWSSLIDGEISYKFYLIFISLNIFTILANGISRKTLNDNVFIIKIKRNKSYILAINIVYFGLVALENYLGSGYIFPALHNVDIHTYSAPIISYFTRCLFVVLMGNFLYWYVTKEKKYLVWMLFFILLPVIGKSSRMDVVISLLQLFTFVMFLYVNDRKLGTRIKKKMFLQKKRYKALFIIAVISLAILMVNYTDYRMNNYGQYELSYSDTIGYTGPESLENVISVYYGYFPLSFNNLNINIKYHEISPNYIGLYSYKSLYFGTFRLHNIFGLNPYQPEVGNRVSSGSATVPTGFFDFYYDYGILNFIPNIIGIIIYLILRRKAISNLSSISNYALYFYWVPLWFFMSFQNVIYSGNLIFLIIILYLFMKYFFKIEHVNVIKSSTNKFVDTERP